MLEDQANNSVSKYLFITRTVCQTMKSNQRRGQTSLELIEGVTKIKRDENKNMTTKRVFNKSVIRLDIRLLKFMSNSQTANI